MPGVSDRTLRANEPATGRQIEYISGLMEQKGITLNADILLKRSRLTKGKAGNWIAKLRQMPTVEATRRAYWPGVPDGYYAIEDRTGVIKFYRVSTGGKGTKWEGHRFLQVQASDSLYPLKNKDAREAVFSVIAQDARAASVRYGKELGRCGVCRRTLTDPDSIADGIGPVCRERQGW